LEERFAKVNVEFPGGSVVGRSLLGTESFAGIPFADPPLGDLRLRPPQRLTTPLNGHDGTGIAPACPQMYASSDARDIIGKTLGTLLELPLLEELNGQEDCLTITVQRPAGTKADAKLPVLFWIFGGAFQIGGANTYDATSLFTSAVLQGQPFIFVAVNYRVNGFGFLGGSEILNDGSANLGLLDQRMGLEWVADNIEAFGGDPERVVIWGESAGSISVFDQMLLYGGNATYKGKNLFRGAIMNSGSAIPADPVDGDKAQAIYDTVVDRAGCAGAADTLSCLRMAPYETFYDAVTSVPGAFSYNSVALSYLPRPDGVVLPLSPEQAGKEGKFYKVPAIIGDQEDEGTLFSLMTSNVTTTERLVNYLSTLYFPKVDRSLIRELVDLYPENASAGSPFRTSIFNEIYPGFKRISALLGDIVFTITRRVVLDIANDVAPEMPTWSYLSSYYYGTPIMGTFHASDILQVFYGVLPNHAMASCRTYYFNFLYNLDPNEGVGGFMKWPRWSEGRKLMWFKSAFANELLKDDFREDSSEFLRDHASDFRI
jgi:carboxylesterase type B